MHQENKVFFWLAPMPPLVLIATFIYISQFDGWGAWAAAPMLLIPIIFSAVIGSYGLLLLYSRNRLGEPLFKLTLNTLLAGSPVLWFLIGAAIEEIQRSFF
jgi:ABC-type spermidine/putrescine transport system permease subunit II